VAPAWPANAAAAARGWTIPRRPRWSRRDPSCSRTPRRPPAGGRGPRRPGRAAAGPPGAPRWPLPPRMPWSWPAGLILVSNAPAIERGGRTE